MRFWCSNPLTEKSERECFGQTCQTAQDEIPNVILLLAPSFLLDESIQSHIQSICRWQVAKEVDCRWARVTAQCTLVELVQMQLSHGNGGGKALIEEDGAVPDSRNLFSRNTANCQCVEMRLIQNILLQLSICKTSHRSKNQLKRKTNTSFNEILLNQYQQKHLFWWWGQKISFRRRSV